MSEFGCCEHQHQYGICDCPRHRRSDLHPMGTVKPQTQPTPKATS